MIDFKTLTFMMGDVASPPLTSLFGQRKSVAGLTQAPRETHQPATPPPGLLLAWGFGLEVPRPMPDSLWRYKKNPIRGRRYVTGGGESREFLRVPCCGWTKPISHQKKPHGMKRFIPLQVNAITSSIAVLWFGARSGFRTPL